MNVLRLAALLCGSMVLSACAAQRAAVPVVAPLPPAWHSANTAPRDSTAAWWHGFGDPALDALEERALVDNTELAGALARLDQARAAARAAGVARLPNGSVSGTLARSQQSLDSGLGRLSRYVPSLSRSQNEASLTGSLGWDLDLAGGLRHGHQAARADAAAAAASLAAARLAVAAEVVDAYLALRANQAQLALAEARAARLDERVHVAEARLARADGSARERDERAVDRATADAITPVLRAAIAANRARLTTLVGLPVNSAMPDLDQPAAIPLPADPAGGTPVDLLRNRPDLVLAEARLTASHARVGSALGEYWPHVTLGGLLGFDTNTLSTFGMGSSAVTQGFIGLRWRLFDFARVDAEVAGARGAEREAIAAYRGAVLNAGEQVETAFIQLAARRAVLAAQQSRLTASHNAAHRADAALRLRDISTDEWRASDLARIEAEAELIDARWQLAQAVLACHRALGG